MPVAVVIGADPALTYAATAPLPPMLDEVLFAGILRGGGIRMTRCKTIDIDVPADAEIVLEGYVDLKEMRTEGPFGDHTGDVSNAQLCPRESSAVQFGWVNPPILSRRRSRARSDPEGSRRTPRCRERPRWRRRASARRRGRLRRICGFVGSTSRDQEK